MRQYFPFLEWIPKYNKSTFSKDVIAGITVGIMLIPQGMAYAMIAGLPPIYGLYASTIPLIIYAFLGTSRQLAVGPVAMVSLLTASGVGSIAAAGSGDYIALAILLALMVGIIQFLMGIFKMGFLVNFLSHPVLSGFTSAAAIIIALSQVKHIVGFEIPRFHYTHETVSYLIQNIGETNGLSLLIGLLGIGLIILMKRIHKAIPSQLVVVILGILVVVLFNLSGGSLNIVGSIPKGLPPLSMSTFEISQWQALLPVALAISMVSFMESIAVSKSIQNKHGTYKLDSNKELIALGSANIVGSFFSSFPVTGGFSRTAVNDQAGAKTTMASVISAVLVLLTLLFLTPLFYNLPKAILASIILVAVYGLIDLKEAKHLWRVNKRDFWLLIITFVTTLGIGIEMGIILGVVASLIMVIYMSTKPHIAVLANIVGSPYYRNIKRFNLTPDPDVLIVRFDGQLYFANSEYFKENIRNLAKEKGEALKLVILNAESIDSIDSTGIHALVELINDLHEKGIDFYMSGIIGPVRDSLNKGGIYDVLDKEKVFVSIAEAVSNYREGTHPSKANSFSKYSLQTNP